MPPKQWDPYKLDEPLQKGDELYITLVLKNSKLEYLTFSDINNEVSDVNVSESLPGILVHVTITWAHHHHSFPWPGRCSR